MTQFTFTKATKAQLKARIAITGPSGSGKTYTALKLATAMCKRVAVIDTEHGSASKYADEFQFDVLEMADFHPDNYVAAIKAAEQAGYDGLIIDSASHEWSGKGGCLELKELFAKRSKGGNEWAAWADVTPLHNGFIEAIHAADMHIFTTYRSKMDYVQAEENGRKVIKKVGMAPVTREGAEYEHDIVLDMDIEHTAVIAKSRCKALADAVVRTPGDELAKAIMNWLNDGSPGDQKPVQEPKPAPATPKAQPPQQQQTQAPKANGAKAKPEGDDRPATEAMLDRWTQIFNEALDLGLDNLPDLSPKVTVKALTLEAQKLKQRITERQAELEVAE